MSLRRLGRTDLSIEPLILGGNVFGWTLDEAAGFLHEPCLREVAERRLPGLVAEAESTGGYRWTNGDGAFNPGLFRGLSGVGYSMLRRVAPALPNPLI